MTNTQPLRIVGAVDADVCEGDLCEIPAHHEQAIVNRAVDFDNV